MVQKMILWGQTIVLCTWNDFEFEKKEWKVEQKSRKVMNSARETNKGNILRQNTV